MKVFISSVILGYEQQRDASARAIVALGHEAKRAEDYAASADTPQRVCLAGVRDADVVVILLGSRYGSIQSTGLSATHEEYREAKQEDKVLVFVEDGVIYEPRQRAFIDEAQQWESGRFTETFRSADELCAKVTRALHRYELAMLSGKPDEDEMLTRARRLLHPGRQSHSPRLSTVVSGGPKREVLRPIELESPDLVRNLTREALFGDQPVFRTEEGTTSRVEDHELCIMQEIAQLSVDSLGTVRVVQSLYVESAGASSGLTNVILQEVVLDKILRALAFVFTVLDLIDPAKRLSHIVPVVTIEDTHYTTWRTTAEHQASPNRIPMNMEVPDRVEALLSPASRIRAALKNDRSALAGDFTVLLRRRWK